MASGIVLNPYNVCLFSSLREGQHSSRFRWQYRVQGMTTCVCVCVYACMCVCVRGRTTITTMSSMSKPTISDSVPTSKRKSVDIRQIEYDPGRMHSDTFLHRVFDERLLLGIEDEKYFRVIEINNLEVRERVRIKQGVYGK